MTNPTRRSCDTPPPAVQSEWAARNTDAIMARRSSSSSPQIPDGPENITDIDVSDEMEASFLEYAYSVIHSRALPDARDGLKPVQRRILYSMYQMGLWPDRGHVKSTRVVGDVMGKLHPHGDSAIYDALVRMAQPFSLRLPSIDGHGNFGSLDDGPAAPRYTEARLAPAARTLTSSLDEDVVDYVPNYDNQLQQPSVLPAGYPNLLVNGASGIAVGMATNMAPHNLVEVCNAAKHLLKHPNAPLETLMKFIPGPDLPSGGRIVGLKGIRDAYESGRGTFKTRATVSIEKVTARRQGIVITELPYLVGPEKIKEKVKEAVQNKKLQGVADIVDLTDRKNGLKLIIEIKNGFNPEAVLAQLYKATPMEDSFGINNVALVDGQPRTLGLHELLTVFVNFRLDVVRRRSAFRLAKRQERLHLIEGLLIAILDIDEVIHIVRTSDDAATAQKRLVEVFDLSAPQAEYILELRLRRLTKFSRIELETERDELRQQIAELEKILNDDSVLRSLVSRELTAVAKEHGTPRRTALLEDDGSQSAHSVVPLQVSDDPCLVLLSTTGLIARTSSADIPPSFHSGHSRQNHDTIICAVGSTVRGEIGAVTSLGRIIRCAVVDIPAMPVTAGHTSLSGGAPVSEYVELGKNEHVIALCSLAIDSPGLALGTKDGIVKRVNTDYPKGPEWEAISLKQGDKVVGAVELSADDDELVFITSDAHLLRFNASLVRPQGRAGGGIAGIKAKSDVIAFGAVPTTALPEGAVVTISSGADAESLPGTVGQSAKVTLFEMFPAKGRATAGVRAHRFLSGETELSKAWVGIGPAMAASRSGKPVELPAVDDRRDGSGHALSRQVATVAGQLQTNIPGLRDTPSVDVTGDDDSS